LFGVLIKVPLGEWEKIPRLQAKTLVCIMMPDPPALRAAPLKEGGK